MKSSSSLIWDRIGLALSTLCLVHCAALPFVIFGLPALARTLQTEWIHIALALLVVPTALLAIPRGFKIHRSKSIVIIGLLGLVLLLSALIWPSLEVALTLSGSVLLMISHTYNLSCPIHHKKRDGFIDPLKTDPLKMGAPTQSVEAP